MDVTKQQHTYTQMIDNYWCTGT